MKKITFKEIEENTNYIYHHTSLHKGYISRKEGEEPIIEEYEGRFGKGYKVYFPNYNSTRYCYVDYYIKKDE